MTSSPTFGPFLRQLRKRAGMTQGDLAAAVGYSVSFVSDLEQNRRLPAVAVVLQQFVPALGLQEESGFAAHLVELAALARGERPPATVTLQRTAQFTLTETFTFPTSHLPTPPTALLGREQAVKLLCNRLQGHAGRLLTLVGPPGVGKTRLALAVAAQLERVYQDGATFIPLAALSDPALMAAELVATLQINDLSQRTLKVKLLEFLRRKELLLVLDNFEQITPAAGLVAELLAACPGLRILVTSRERLHLRAEQRYQVPPLVPAVAVALFTRCAQAVDLAFEPTVEQQPIIEAICLRLDCLPLAIELIAAHIDLFSPAVMLARLSDRGLDLLDDGPHDAPARHRTLRNAIHRSYELCTPEEQRLFRALGVFVGGFDLAAVLHFGFAEAALQALVHKNLVKVEGQAPRRFLLLETVRDYAREQLIAANELAAVGEQHANYFFKLAKDVKPLGGSAEKSWGERLNHNHDNLRAALGWLIQFDAVMGQEMASELSAFWLGNNLFSEGRDWLAKVLAASTLPTPSRARALQAAGELAQDQNDNRQAIQLAQESLTLFETQGDPAGCACALYVIGWALVEMEQPAQALLHFERSLPLARQAEQLGLVAFASTNIARMLIQLGEPHTRILPLLNEAKILSRQRNRPPGIARALRTEAMLCLSMGDSAQAALLLQEALSLFRPLGVQLEVAVTLEMLAATVWRMGDDINACVYLAEALQFFQENDIKLGLIDVWYGFGQLERCLRHNLDLAAHYYGKSLMLCQEKNYKKLFGRALVGLAGVAQVRCDPAQSARLLGKAQQLFDDLSPFFILAERNEYAKLITDVHTQLGETAFALAWAEGQAMTADQAVALALAQFDTLEA